MPNQHRAIRVHAESEVAKIEGLSTRKANEKILDYADGRKPLSWLEIGPFPFSCGKLRIRLDAGTPDDYEQASYEQRVKAKRDHDRALFRATCLDELAKTARHLGKTVVSEIGDLPIRPMPEGHQHIEDDFLDGEDDDL